MQTLVKQLELLLLKSFYRKRLIYSNGCCLGYYWKSLRLKRKRSCYRRTCCFLKIYSNVNSFYELIANLPLSLNVQQIRLFFQMYYSLSNVCRMRLQKVNSGLGPLKLGWQPGTLIVIFIKQNKANLNIDITDNEHFFLNIKHRFKKIYASHIISGNP